MQKRGGNFAGDAYAHRLPHRHSQRGRLPSASSPLSSRHLDRVRSFRCGDHQKLCHGIDGPLMLTPALLVKPDPTAIASAAAEPAPKVPADEQTSESIGAQVDAHAGHRVEVAGTMLAAGRNGSAPASADLSRTAHSIAGTVKTVTMISSTCP